MWFKKNSQISGFNTNTAVDGTDWRTNVNSNSYSVSQTPPSAADAGNYFYLPTLGFYNSGKLLNVGYGGFYWSSSTNGSNSACGLTFGSVYVSVDRNTRSFGFRVGGFE